MGYVLGPRLNAAGRIGHADDALALLMATDKGEAAALAQKLDEMNRKRQQIELRVVDEAYAQAEAALGARHSASVLVVAAEGWHPGVVGLAAARLKERFGLPSMVLAINKTLAMPPALHAPSPGLIWARRCARLWRPDTSSRAAAMPWRQG